jgi:hypothetical protein
LSEEPLLLLNVSMDIEDVHVPRILIFINKHVVKLQIVELNGFLGMREHILDRVHQLS